MQKQFIAKMVLGLVFGSVVIAGIGYFTPALWQGSEPVKSRENFVRRFEEKMPSRHNYLIQPAYDSYLEQRVKDIIAPFLGEEYVRAVVHTELAIKHTTIEREKIIPEKEAKQPKNASEEEAYIKQKTTTNVTSFDVKRTDSFVFLAQSPDKERNAFFKSKKQALMQSVQRVIGYNPERGDTFQVIDFPATLFFDPSVVISTQYKQIAALLLLSLAALAAFMGAFMLISSAKNRKYHRFAFAHNTGDENMYRNQIIGTPEENLIAQMRQLCFQMPEVAVNALRSKLYDASGYRASNEGAFSPAQQAAIVLLCLGDKGVRLCFKRMSDAEIKTISRIMAGLGSVKAMEIHPIVLKFCRQMRQPQDIIAPLAQTKAYIRNALSAERAAQLLKELEKPVVGKTVWEKLGKISESKIAAFLSREYPQTAAEILYCLATEKAALVIAALSARFAAETLLRMSAFCHHEEIKPALFDFASGTPKAPVTEKALSGEAKAAAVLSLAPDETRKKILAQIRLFSPQGADGLLKQLITFDDFALWDEEDLSILLKYVDEKTLVTALSNASNATKEKFSRVITPRKWGKLLQDISRLPSGSVQQIDASQKAVIQIAHQLIDARKCKGKMA